MKAKIVYVLWTPHTILGVYEDKKTALELYGDLLQHESDIRLTCELIVPDLPF